MLSTKLTEMSAERRDVDPWAASLRLKRAQIPAAYKEPFRPGAHSLFKSLPAMCLQSLSN